MAELPIVNVYLAREMARRGDRDDAIPLMRAALDHLFREGRLLGWGTPLDGGSGADTALPGERIKRQDAIAYLGLLVIGKAWHDEPVADVDAELVTAPSP